MTKFLSQLDCEYYFNEKYGAIVYKNMPLNNDIMVMQLLTIVTERIQSIKEALRSEQRRIIKEEIERNKIKANKITTIEGILKKSGVESLEEISCSKLANNLIAYRFIETYIDEHFFDGLSENKKLVWLTKLSETQKNIYSPFSIFPEENLLYLCKKYLDKIDDAQLLIHVISKVENSERLDLVIQRQNVLLTFKNLEKILELLPYSDHLKLAMAQDAVDAV